MLYLVLKHHFRHTINSKSSVHLQLKSSLVVNITMEMNCVGLTNLTMDDKIECKINKHTYILYVYTCTPVYLLRRLKNNECNLYVVATMVLFFHQVQNLHKQFMKLSEYFSNTLWTVWEHTSVSWAASWVSLIWEHTQAYTNINSESWGFYRGVQQG